MTCFTRGQAALQPYQLESIPHIGPLGRGVMGGDAGAHKGSSIPKKNFEDAPRAPALQPAEKHEKVADYEQNYEDAPHAPAPPPAENHEKVVDYEKNSEDAPHASTATRRKPREG